MVEALSIRTKRFGEQHETVAAVLQYMGTLEFRAGDLNRAYQLLDEFIRIRQESGSENDGEYVNVLFMIGNIHKMQGNEDEAQRCWTEAYGIFQELGLGDGNPQIQQAMGNLVQQPELDSRPEAAPDDFDEEEHKPKSSKGVLGRLTDKVKGKKKQHGLQL